MSFASSSAGQIVRPSLPFSLSVLALFCSTSTFAEQSATTAPVMVVADAPRPRRMRPKAIRPRPSSLATQTDTPLVEIPQAVSVVTEQQLEDRQPQSLDEALSSVAGLKQSNTLGGTQDATAKARLWRQPG